MARDHQPPPRHLLVPEAWSFASRFWRWFGRLGERGPAHGPPLMIIPGLLIDDHMTLGLQRAFARAGYRVTGWGLGLNRGAYGHLLEDIAARLEIFSSDEPIILVGWSIGGCYAREVAKRRPDLVRSVFTMGSPFSGSLRANNVWKLYERIAGHPVDRPPIDVDLPSKPPVPTYALWSSIDGVVAPASARGNETESDERIEVKCRHMAFATNGRAIREIVRIVRERT